MARRPILFFNVLCSGKSAVVDEGDISCRRKRRKTRVKVESSA